MSSNIQNNEDEGSLLPGNFGATEQMSWSAIVEQEARKGELKVYKCSCYSTPSNQSLNDEIKCVCGRLARKHSFTGEPKTQFQNAKKWTPKLATLEDVAVYGELRHGARLIRCYMGSDATYQSLAHMIAKDVGSEPKLLVSCYGGAEYFKMNDNLEREFLNGIAQVVATQAVWLVTTGLNSGVSKLIGKGVRRSKLLNRSSSKTTVIGMSHWGTLSEYTHQMIKSQVSNNVYAAPWQMTPFLGKIVTKTLDKHHTHFLLFDDGRFDEYLTDDPRSEFVQNTCKKENCYAVTIIVDGGLNTLEVITNDLKKKRPVVIVHGSGRLADILSNLLENTANSTVIGREKIDQQLEISSRLWPEIKTEKQDIIKGIESVLDPKFRPYLSVFRLGQDASLTNTIFRAVFETQTEPKNQEKLLELAVNWDCLDGAQNIFKSDENLRIHYPRLFEQALKENRPVFVDYFLRGYHNPLRTTAFINYENTEKHAVQNPSTNKNNTEDKVCVKFALQFIVEALYQTEGKIPSVWYPRPQTFEGLKRHYSLLIGPYAESFYDDIDSWTRLREELKSFFYSWKLRRLFARRAISAPEPIKNKETLRSIVLKLSAIYDCSKPYGKQEMLRDLFFWSVYIGYDDIAFVLLLQLKSRIGAALLATDIAQRLSLSANNLDMRKTYDGHRIAYEEYAQACIEACYKHNEQFACQLLLREIPLYGNITCMQAAIASRNISFINTDCFDEVLNRQWFGHLENTSSTSIWIYCKVLLHLMSFGVFAPLLLDYRSADNMNQKYYLRNEMPDKPWMGIDDQSIEQANYWVKLKNFHGSPFVKVFYQFLVYVWFLLVFSYMMLFHIRAPVNKIYWTEIYLIITVSAALLEDIRKRFFEFYTQMMERWHKADSWILNIYALPYILFYIGIGLHLRSIARPELFTAARIVLAIDLELWYLFSLHFVSAVKLWGPKLFMIRNMMRDLSAFIYIIFVCMTAYGVVSSALTMYSTIEFSAKSLSSAILYRPYWFIFGIIDDEKVKLGEIISSNTNSTGIAVEATVTQILLAFHMLFINILILNLLIAVFNFSINDVQQKNEYFWRYQRYELIREYFEKPMFAYPPFSLLVYIWLFIKLCMKCKVCQVFKRLATTDLDHKWTEYESEATYHHARSFVEAKYRLRNTTENPSFLPEPKDDLTLQEHMNKLNGKVVQMHGVIDSIQDQTNKIMLRIDQLMEGRESNRENVSSTLNIYKSSDEV